MHRNEKVARHYLSYVHNPLGDRDVAYYTNLIFHGCDKILTNDTQGGKVLFCLQVLVYLRTTCSEMSPSTVGWILPHLSLIRNAPQAYLWLDVISSKVVSLFIVDTSLVQSDKSLTKALIIYFPRTKDIYLSSEGMIWVSQMQKVRKLISFYLDHHRVAYFGSWFEGTVYHGGEVIAVEMCPQSGSGESQMLVFSSSSFVLTQTQQLRRVSPPQFSQFRTILIDMPMGVSPGLFKILSSLFSNLQYYQQISPCIEFPLKRI